MDAEVPQLLAYAQTVPRDDDLLWRRLDEYVRRDPRKALLAGLDLLTSPDPARREFATSLVGIAGQIDQTLRPSCASRLRQALEDEIEAGPISAAIIQLGNLADESAHEAILAHLEHPDPLVRHAVAVALPTVGLNEPALAAALSFLTTDIDDDVRDWATFGLAELTDADDERVRQALLARAKDTAYETRVEAIVGLARRQDERVRPHLARELAEPDHAEALDWATGYLETGSERRRFG
jgi:HEAT repeat protein